MWVDQQQTFGEVICIVNKLVLFLVNMEFYLRIMQTWKALKMFDSLFNVRFKVSWVRWRTSIYAMSWKDHMQERTNEPMKGFLLNSGFLSSCWISIKSFDNGDNLSANSKSVVETLGGCVCCDCFIGSVINDQTTSLVSRIFFFCANDHQSG
jgi:hypothetical protein